MYFLRFNVIPLFQTIGHFYFVLNKALKIRFYTKYINTYNPKQKHNQDMFEDFTKLI